MKIVEQLMQEAVDRVFPAAQLVVLEQRKPVLRLAVGDCTPSTLFDIASLTKPLSTVALVKQLYARGRLSLDDEPRPGTTVRLLLCHASGLPGWKLLGDFPKPVIVERVRHEPLERAPGSASVYSDLGFILLGDAVERAAGAPLDVLFRDHIAEGREIGYGPRPAERCAPAEGLRGVVHDENARAMGGVAGHAGLFAHADDVAALTLGWLDDPGIFWTPSGIPQSTWCLGWDRPSAAGSSAGTRWPRDGVGHLGFTGCSLWIDPPRGRAVILLSNRVQPSRENQAIKAFRPVLHDTIVEALDGPTSFR